jgi:hypothetical protein
MIMRNNNKLEYLLQAIWPTLFVTDCARAQYEHRKLTIVGKFFNCASNGNYKKIQCQGSVCFCAGENGQMLHGAEQVHVTQKGSLNC